MTEQQQAFADYYLETGNQTEAAKRAGYSEKTAYSQGNRLLKHVEIKEYIKRHLAEIEQRRAEKAQRRIATVDDVLQFLTDGMNGEIKDQFGLDPSLQDRITCAKELLKRYNAITPKTEKHSDTVQAIIKAVEAVD